jgi:carbon-monoxide dehydrogenase medium subunit
MIPAPFSYERPDSLAAAIDSLVRHGEEAKLLAGGHSLLPLMKLRLAAPSVLIDIGRLSDLSYIREEEGHLAIGALTRHGEIAQSPLVAGTVPLLAHVAGQIGDPQVRHRGTIGGSLVHGDPASDLPAVLLALGGRVRLAGPAGERVVDAADFFLGFLETATGPDEIAVEVQVPQVAGPWAFEKFTRRAQDWAIVAVAAALTDAGPAVALVNMAPTPRRAVGVEAVLAAGGEAAAAAERAGEGTSPVSDTNASAAFRLHLAEVLTARALTTLGL